LGDEIGSRRTRLRADLRRIQSLMIVMKFGGSSAASATAVEWMAGIVKSPLEDQPVLVVSAMGETTDRLVEMMQHAARGSEFRCGAFSRSYAASTFRKSSNFWVPARPAY
jgi:aspartokinase